MQRIFAESFAGGYRRVVMIGTDAPEMNRATVHCAFRLLSRNAAVFQPTDDGGYALVGLAKDESGGMKDEMPDIFSGIAWSTDRVMAQTRARLRKLGKAHAELPATFDVDTAADLARLTS
jgi:glycosyltransferase A (GT-A) superfamily protein (DUF2064 family)